MGVPGKTKVPILYQIILPSVATSMQWFDQLSVLSTTLTSIAGLVHVNDLNLMTQILVSPCHICSVYAIKEFGYPNSLMAYTDQV